MKKDYRKRLNRMQLAATLCGLLLILSVAIPAMAWFRQMKSIQTITMINDPNMLIIGAGDAQSFKKIELGYIDVSQSHIDHKDVVFCVYSTGPRNYYLQLAHTTNIGFRYQIFPAVKGSGGGSEELTYLGNTYTFDLQKPLAGDYLNKIDEHTLLGRKDGNYHNTTYANGDQSYTEVQKNAEPLYWKADGMLSLAASPNLALQNIYVNHFVLRISWDTDFTNNKETDMLYLMADTLQ